MGTADPTTSRRTATPGSIALGRSTDTGPRALIGDRPLRPLPVPDEPFRLDGEVIAAEVTDDASHLAALDAARRGADVVAEVAADRLAAFVEDVDRLGIALWQPDVGPTTGVEWPPLLDELAAGATIEQAARRCNLSLRSAHRRLADARRVLGVSTTAAAVARWTATDSRRRT